MSSALSWVRCGIWNIRKKNDLTNCGHHIKKRWWWHLNGRGEWYWMVMQRCIMGNVGSTFLELDTLKRIEDKYIFTTFFFLKSVYGVALLIHWTTPLGVFFSILDGQDNGPTCNCIFWRGRYWYVVLISPCCHYEERKACLNGMMTSPQTGLVKLQVSMNKPKLSLTCCLSKKKNRLYFWKWEAVREHLKG